MITIYPHGYRPFTSVCFPGLQSQPWTLNPPDQAEGQAGRGCELFLSGSGLVLLGSNWTQIPTCWGINHLKRAPVSFRVTPRKGRVSTSGPLVASSLRGAAPAPLPRGDSV